MLRITPKLTVVLLCGSMLAGCASTGTNIASSASAKKEAAAAAINKSAPTDLDSGLRQAQLMRTAGQYDNAVRTLSQLMLVASDDPRVVGEYGKTLAEKGRAQDATEFLTRAIELSPSDWTLYSALGVSYDQLGNQTMARAAYDHALQLRPEEPSVLNNYALSRMMAGDTAGAKLLIGRAQAAGGASDSKIAANIALLNKVALNADAAKDVAMIQKTVSAQPESPAAAKPAAPVQPIAQNKPAAAAPQAVAMPRPATPGPQPVAKATPSVRVGAQQAAPRQAAIQKPKPAAPALRNDATAKSAPVGTAMLQPPRIEIYDPPAKPVDTKTAAAKPASPASAPVKTASKDGVPALRMTADARSP